MGDAYEMPPLYANVRRIETSEEAMGWTRHLLEKLIDVRGECNVMIPGNPRATVLHQRRAERQFLIHYGSFTGVLRALHATGKLGDSSYELLRRDGASTLGATIVGAL